MKAVKSADELPPEHFKTVQPASPFTSQIEIESGPMGVRVSGVMAEHFEFLFPLRPAVTDPEGFGQRPIECVAPRDPEQLEGSVVDQVRQLLDLIVEKPVPSVQTQLPLNP